MDSEYLVINGFAHLFKKHRTLEEFTREIQREVFLHPLREELAKLFPEENTEVLAREYKAYMKGIQGRHLVETLPHVSDTLKQLKDSGYVLGVVTGRYTDSCVMWLEDLQIDQYFDIVAGTETYRHTKPSPDGILHTCDMLKVGHDSVVYVGDGVKDVQAGRNAGVYTIAFVTNEEKRAALEKAKLVSDKLKELKLSKASQKVSESIHETLTYMSFPMEHWTRIRSNNVLERLNREIKRRTKVVGTFPDGESALMLVCARLRHVASHDWGAKRYLNMDHLISMNISEEENIIAG